MGSFPQFFTFHAVNFVGILQMVGSDDLRPGGFLGHLMAGGELCFADGHIHSPDFTIH
jgi:hypothetical protein